MHRNEELTGVFEWERNVFQDGDPDARTVIGELADGTVVKGRARRGALECGLTYRFIGQWTRHSRFGKQFHFSSFAVAMPAGESATVKYLAKIGQGFGMGRRRAQQAWNLFGSQVCDIIRAEPERLAAEIPGVTKKMAAGLAAEFRRHEALEKTTIEVNDLLGSRGFPRSLPGKAIREWGADAPRMIREHPYRLMQFSGAGFAHCDALYLELGHDPAAIERQGYSIWYALVTDGNGHTWHPLRTAEQSLSRSIASAAVRPKEALAWAAEQDLLSELQDSAGRRWIAESPKAWAEERIAAAVGQAEREAMVTPPAWPELEGTAEDDGLPSLHQADEANKATGGYLGILAGSPGTGKTFVLAAIIRAIKAARGMARIAVCAPTGKAAVRATESLAAQGLPIVATTIHRLLGVVQADQDGSRDQGWRFEHDAENPLPLNFLLVDEGSMVDTTLLAALLSARMRGCHVLIVGDPNQLAPVGHGAPLRDLIAAGVPCGTLTKIRRNAGRIVKSCAEIRDRQRITFSPQSPRDFSAEHAENLVLIEQSKPDAQVAALEQFYGELNGDSKIWNVQVVVPVNDKSPLARKKLNKHLQELLNPNGEKLDGCPFRAGDKIVCTKNGTLPLIEGDSNGALVKGEAYVANGEQARVVELAPHYFAAALDLPQRLVRVPRGKQKDASESGDEEKSSTGCDFDLAYAISVHKSQGSEWPIVVVMLDSYAGALRVTTREWIYTAISRAKTLCVCIGRKIVADTACRQSGLWDRKTFLRERILEHRGKLLCEVWSEDLQC